MPEFELPWDMTYKPAREAWYYAEPRTRKRVWAAALRPHKDGRVEVVENTLGGTVGYFPTKLAKEWHPRISAHVARHAALPVVPSGLGTGYALFVVLPDGDAFAVAPTPEPPTPAPSTGGIVSRLFGKK